MIPLGYMLKQVVPPPEWLAVPLEKAGVPVDLIYSVASCCTSRDFAEYISLWKHNGWWLFDDPDALSALALGEGCDPAALTLFYYEAHDEEYDEDARVWQAIAPEPGLTTAVRVPMRKTLCGYDVVSFAMRNAPESSPLSCCMLAAETKANRFCLLDSFEAAVDFVQSPLLDGAEPGPYRIIAVYRPQMDQ